MSQYRYKNKKNNCSLITFTIPKTLPINEKRIEIVQAISTNQVVVISGETGCGKSTILPLLCTEAKCMHQGRIGITQPRRIAAISLATYVSSLILSKSNAYVGFKVRFYGQVTSETKLKFLTDGVLLAEISSDPLLKEYDVIIIDEAHERSCNIDFLLGYLRTLLPKRPDLKLIISSATLDTGFFSRCFNRAPVITIPGRTYPVHIVYKPLLAMWDGEKVDTYLKYVVTVIDETLSQESDGDILLFLPTVQDILEIIYILKNKYSDKNIVILPLYSSMRVSDQKKIFKYSKARKIIVATNIAETSITVPRIRYVIDTGLARVMRYEPSLHTSRIPIERISRASADQRAGRSGRVRDGICIRLFPENDYNARPLYSTPEIKRSNIAGIILRMHQLNLGKIEQFPFLQRPSQPAIKEAYRQLRTLGALDNSNRLTILGKEMAMLPLDPPIACMLLIARDHGAVKEVSIIASALSVEDPRLDTNQFPVTNHKQSIPVKSDFMVFLTIWYTFQRFLQTKKLYKGEKKQNNGYMGKLKEKRKLNSILYKFCSSNNLSFHRMREWYDVHEQILLISKSIPDLRKQNLPASYVAIHKSLICGLIENILMKQSNGLYCGIYNHDIMIVPGSILSKKTPKWIIAHEIFETKRIYARTIALIKPQWIEQLFQELCNYSYTQHHYDSQDGVIKAVERIEFKGLPLVKQRIVNYSKKCPQRAHTLFIREALVKGKLENSFAFVFHNARIQKEIESFEHKLRSRDIYVGDRELELFYDERLSQVCSIQDLNKAIRSHGSDKFLHIRQSDLIARPLPPSIHDYPNTVKIGSTQLKVEYIYSPGDINDGATIMVPLTIYKAIPPYYWEWLLPIFWRPRVEEIIEMIKDKIETSTYSKYYIVETVMSMLECRPCSFLTAIHNIIEENFGFQSMQDLIDYNYLSAYLWCNVSVVNEKGKVINHSRSPFSKPSIPNPTLSSQHPFWEPFCKPFSRSQVIDWTFGVLPQYIKIGSDQQIIPLPAIRVLHSEKEIVNIRVFFSFEYAITSHARGIQALAEKFLAEELAWKIRSLALPERVVRRFNKLLPKERLNSLFIHLFIETVLELPKDLPYDKDTFSIYRNNALLKIDTSPEQLVDLFSRVVDEYEKCVIQIERIKKKSKTNTLYQGIYSKVEKTLDIYMTQFISSNHHLFFVYQLPRYLRALWWRIETGHVNPGRYLQCMEKLLLFQTQYKKLLKLPHAKEYENIKKLEELFGMIEEYAISLFAQQKVATLFSISELKVKQKIELLNYIIK